MGLCVNLHLLHKETDEGSGVLIYGFGNKSLGVSLILCSFGRIIVSLRAYDLSSHRFFALIKVIGMGITLCCSKT